MLEDTDFNFDSHDTIELIHQYESTLQIHEHAYFDVDQFEEIIDHYIENEVLDKATQTVEAALSIHPNTTSLLIRLAQIEIDNNECDKALEILLSLEKIEPSNNDIKLLKGTAYLLQDNLYLAGNEFNKALESTTIDKAETNYIIGYQYCQSGFYVNAIEYFKNAQTKAKKHLQALFELGFCYERIGDFKESLKVYLQYIDIDAFSDTAWFNIGTLYGRLNDHEKAIEAFEYSLALNPDFTSALFNKANALSCTLKYKEAAEAFEEYTDLEPGQFEAYCYLAECYEKMGKPEVAQTNYRIAIDLNPDFADAWHGLGVVQSMLGFEIESLESLHKALNLDKQNTNIWYSLGKILAKQKRNDEALLALKKSIELDELNHESWLSIADLYHKTEQLTEAINTLFEAVKTNKEIAPLHFRLAGYLALSGKQSEALSYLDKGLRLNYYDYCEFLKVFPNGLEDEPFGNIVNKYKPPQQ